MQLTDAGRRDPVLGLLSDQSRTIQWHGDTFDLPTGAERLASSPHCPNQAFRAGRCAYALQFHLEVTAEQIGQWREVPAYASALADTLGPINGQAFLDEAWLDLAAEVAGQCRDGSRLSAA